MCYAAGEVVEWINDQDEQCLPYDLVVKHVASGEVTAFVEVKASSSWDKTYFEVRLNELLGKQ